MTAIEKFTFALSFDDADNVIRSSGADDEHYDVGKKKKKEEEEAPPPPPPAGLYAPIETKSWFLRQIDKT